VSAVLRAIDALLKWAGILLIASPLLWLVLARIDVPLSAEAAAWLQPEPDDMPADQNAYYAFIGFYAEDADADINRFGRRMLEEYVERLRQEPDLKDFKYRQEVKITGKPAELCNPTKASCLKTARTHRVAVSRLAQDNALLLARYRSLYRYRHYRETGPMSFYSPLPVYPGVAHDLLLAEVAQGALERPTPALEALARDVEFWRMVLRETRHVIGKAIATRLLLADLHLLSDILASTPIRENDDAVVKRMLRPLDAEDRSLAAAMRNEYRTVAASWPQLLHDSVGKGLEKHSALVRATVLSFASTAYRPNHTANLLHEHVAEALRAERSRAESPIAEAAAPERRRFGASVLDFLYNPAGKYFVFEAPPDMTAYSARVRDLDGFVRLVTLQWTLRKNRTAAAGVPAFLASSTAALRDPFTGQPMNWDAGTKTLWFSRKGGRKEEKDRLEVRL